MTERLKAAHASVEARLDALGVEVFHRPRAGLFVWAKPPVEPARAGEMATAALRDGIWLAPGSCFRPDDASSAWFRFNAPYSADDALWRFIERALTVRAAVSRPADARRADTSTRGAPAPWRR